MPDENGTMRPAAPNQQGLAIVQNAEVIARLYRRLILLIGLQILLSIVWRFLLVAGANLVALLVAIALLVSVIAIVVTAYKLAEEMGLGLPILWAVAMLVPCINILTLLVLSGKAQTWCRRYGIKVGFLGPTPESIEELRRRMMTSPFE